MDEWYALQLRKNQQGHEQFGSFRHSTLLYPNACLHNPIDVAAGFCLAGFLSAEKIASLKIQMAQPNWPWNSLSYWMKNNINKEKMMYIYIYVQYLEKLIDQKRPSKLIINVDQLGLPWRSFCTAEALVPGVRASGTPWLTLTWPPRQNNRFCYL